MTPEVRAFIVKCFCRRVSAADAAWCANHLFEIGYAVTEMTVRAIWDQERAANVVIRDLEAKLGARPHKGYVPCEHARLAEQLAAV